MIVSASYKTDIPTFYGRWFRNRLKAGFCRTVNPYNPRQHSRVSLLPEDVDGFVFWTKNASPFVEALDDVRSMEIPFVLQHTANGYPRELESRVVSLDKSLDTMRSISTDHGRRSVVWRYDTIVHSSITPRSFHEDNFGAIAKNLAGYVDEVVVSFMHPYSKTKANMDRAAAKHGFQWWDPDDSEKKALLAVLASAASESKISLTLCSQPHLAVNGVSEARCVDAQRLSDLGSGRVNAKLGGPRQECGCYRSRDIGDYDTCPHGCVYCYAVRKRSLALERFEAHDPDGEYLFPPKYPMADSKPRPAQLKLID